MGRVRYSERKRERELSESERDMGRGRRMRRKEKTRRKMMDLEVGPPLGTQTNPKSKLKINI